MHISVFTHFFYTFLCNVDQGNSERGEEKGEIEGREENGVSSSGTYTIYAFKICGKYKKCFY